jgi:hypothetical protein
MARRKRKRPTKPAKLDVLAHKRLDDLQTRLGSQELPLYVDQMEILSALVLYTTPEQAAGMLRGYWRYTDRLTEADEAEPASEDEESA